ncbi:MAG TPA: succinate dehydrogenase cytochrome b subunit [Gemmataceae bacterium]|jgi:succinate dehydrogenase / fumarate reductase cytochrome b subunit
MEVQTISSISARKREWRAEKRLPLRGALSSLARQYVMAITGVGLILFVLVHMTGNLLIFAGRDALNAYAHSLDEHPGFLWSARALLLIAFAVHVLVGIQLTVQDHAARPIHYVCWKPLQSSWAARHMLLTGLLVLAFVIYHLLHFTFGVTDPRDFKYAISRDPRGFYDVAGMVVGGFSQTPVAVGYIAAQIILGLHLAHGAWSWFQHLGLNRENSLFLPSDRLKTRTWFQLLRPDRRGYARFIHGFGVIVTILVILGNCSIPLAIQLGWRPRGYEEPLSGNHLSREWSPLP